jgi:hypothetical protein
LIVLGEMRRKRKREAKHGVAADDAVNADLASVGFDEAAADVQAEAKASDTASVLGRSALEALENSFGVFGW